MGADFSDFYLCHLRNLRSIPFGCGSAAPYYYPQEFVQTAEIFLPQISQMGADFSDFYLCHLRNLRSVPFGCGSSALYYYPQEFAQTAEIFLPQISQMGADFSVFYLCHLRNLRSIPFGCGSAALGPSVVKIIRDNQCNSCRSPLTSSAAFKSHSRSFASIRGSSPHGRRTVGPGRWRYVAVGGGRLPIRVDPCPSVVKKSVMIRVDLSACARRRGAENFPN